MKVQKIILWDSSFNLYSIKFSKIRRSNFQTKYIVLLIFYVSLKYDINKNIISNILLVYQN